MTRKLRRGSLYRRGNIWWLKYNLDGKRIAMSLETESKAEAKTKQMDIMKPLLASERADALANIKAKLELAENEVAHTYEEANPPLSLANTWAAYVAAENRPQSGPDTLANYAGHLKAFTAWLHDQHPTAAFLRDITPEMAAGYMRHMDKLGFSGNTQNKHRQFLKTLFRVLAKPGRIDSNPFADIARRKHLPATRRPLTIEELKRIIETADGEMKTLFMVGTFTGLRLGDAATLQWGETDLARAIIRRIPHKTARTGQAVIIGIPAILGHHLAGLERQGPYVMPGIANRYLTQGATALADQIMPHLESCGIQTIKPGTGSGTGKRAVVVAGFHSLRHSFVSLHAQAGTPQAILQKLAGHGNPMMTEHYTHIDEATARATAAALPSVLTAPQKALPTPDIKSEARRLADMLTAKTWQQVKSELEKLAQ